MIPDSSRAVYGVTGEMVDGRHAFCLIDCLFIHAGVHSCWPRRHGDQSAIRGWPLPMQQEWHINSKLTLRFLL